MELGALGRPPIPAWWYLIPASSVLALAVAFALYRSLMRSSEGNERMREIADAVRTGAQAYLRRQYAVVAVFFAVMLGVLAFMAFGLEAQHRLVPFAFLTGGLFSGLAGFFGMKTATNASARTARAASESLNAALQVAFRAGAVMGLVVVGLALFDISVWFYFLYVVYHRLFGGEPMALETITVVMLCFGMGASAQALFARVGGGIFTKAADVGADLVGKVEAGIPEDDPRNPAVIADNVGDNVGDVAGMGADLYESYAGSILATAALGVATLTLGELPRGFRVDAGEPAESLLVRMLSAPMLLAAAGIVVSIGGIFLVRTREGADMKQLLWALNRGIYGASLLVVVAAAGVVAALGLPWGVFVAIVVGLLVGLAIGKGTERYTAAEYRPTQDIAATAESGTGPLIISGIAEGMASTWIPVVSVSAGMIIAFTSCDGFSNLLMGLYGVGIAAVGMLSTLGITLATDAYGPIADNAGGNAEMAGLGKHVRDRTDALDALGNTTAAVGKGFAIGSAALTALALLAAYVEEVRVALHREVSSSYPEAFQSDGADYTAVSLGAGRVGIFVPGAGPGAASRQRHTVSAILGEGEKAVTVRAGGERLRVKVNHAGEIVRQRSLAGVDGAPITFIERDPDDPSASGAVWQKKADLRDYMAFYDVTLVNPNVLVGLFTGVMMVFVFSAMTMKAVGRAAAEMVAEVRGQFRDNPGIMEGLTRPDYARCVLISTKAAQRAMALPTLLAVGVPVAVGILLDVGGVMGLLVGGLCSGYAMAVFMANAGGAWDNAKKIIEAGKHGGKGGIAHRSAVVGDTVGDPFKDTSGPSLNILIKLMNMVSIVFVGLVIKYAPIVGSLLFIR